MYSQGNIHGAGNAGSLAFDSWPRSVCCGRVFHGPKPLLPPVQSALTLSTRRRGCQHHLRVHAPALEKLNTGLVFPLRHSLSLLLELFRVLGFVALDTCNVVMSPHVPPLLRENIERHGVCCGGTTATIQRAKLSRGRVLQIDANAHVHQLATPTVTRPFIKHAQVARYALVPIRRLNSLADVRCTERTEQNVAQDVTLVLWRPRGLMG